LSREASITSRAASGGHEAVTAAPRSMPSASACSAGSSTISGGSLPTVTRTTEPKRTTWTTGPRRTLATAALAALSAAGGAAGSTEGMFGSESAPSRVSRTAQGSTTKATSPVAGDEQAKRRPWGRVTTVSSPSLRAQPLK